jgi:hypothetical protein
VLTAFLVIFIAEWGDLTQILTANLAAKYHSALSVGVGSTLALWAVATVAVASGPPVRPRGWHRRAPPTSAAQPRRYTETAAAVDGHRRAGTVRREHQGHPVADTAHRSLLSEPSAEDGAGLHREEESPGGIEARDGPRPTSRVGVVAEVYELSEGGAVPEIAHPVSVRVVRRQRGRFSQFLVGYLPVNGGRGGTR